MAENKGFEAQKKFKKSQECQSVAETAVTAVSGMVASPIRRLGVAVLKSTPSTTPFMFVEMFEKFPAAFSPVTVMLNVPPSGSWSPLLVTPSHTNWLFPASKACVPSKTTSPVEEERTTMEASGINSLVVRLNVAAPLFKVVAAP